MAIRIIVPGKSRYSIATKCLIVMDGDAQRGTVWPDAGEWMYVANRKWNVAPSLHLAARALLRASGGR